MAVKYPQFGNADIVDTLFLDDGPAGQIVFADYFEAAAAGSINADLTATESGDTLSASSTLSSAGINASLGITEASDTSTASATLPITATATYTEGTDTSSGQAVLPIQAAGSTTEAGDTANATAVLAIAASLTQGEQADTVSSTASSGAVPLNANFNATEAGDTLQSAATLEVQQPQEIGFLDGIGTTKTKRDEDRKRLDDLIEAAFERAVAPGEVPTKADAKQVVQSVRQEIKLDGIQATLAQVRKAVDEYAAMLKRKADDDEEEFIAFMMLG